MVKLSRLSIGFVLAIGLGSSTDAVAGVIFDGETVTFQYYFPDLSTTNPFSDNGDKLVGAGVEVSNVADGVATMDISDTNMFVDFSATGFFLPGVFNGFKLTDTFASVPDFIAVLINPATNMAGFDASKITFDGDNILVNWQGLSFTPDTIVSLDVVAGVAVPEPGSLSLLAASLIGLIAARSRMRKRGARERFKR